MEEDKIIVRAEEEVVCPKCTHAFPLKAGIAQHTIELRQEELEQATKAFQEQIAAQLSKDAERKATQLFTSQISQLQEQLAGAKRSEREAKEAIERARAEAREKATADQAQERKALEEELAHKTTELQTMKAMELDLRRQKQELEEQKRSQELELQRKLDEERSKISQQIGEREAERFRMIEAEYKKKLADVQSANDDLRRKLDQGSQQLQGEVLELHVEKSLTTTFFHDLIEEVKKGVRGADVIQTVRTAAGAVAGKIIWEAKRAENWSDKWLEKLKDDQQEAKADLAVLVTTAMPKGADGPFVRIGDVWVVTPTVLKPMAETLRVILLETQKLRVASTGKAEKVELLYNYLASPTFSQRMRTVFDSFTAMQTDLDAEKRAFAKIWGKRQTQIDRLTMSMGTVIGELQAIAQDSLPGLQSIDTLESIALTNAASDDA